MIAAAYLVLKLCSHPDCGTAYIGAGRPHSPIAAVAIPQPSMDQCIRQANAFNKHRKDTRAMCVPGSET